MADTQSNIQVNIDTDQALASIKNLQRQISAFHSSMAKGGAAANAVSTQLQQTLINSINATGKFSAQIRTIRTTTESFTNSLEKNKFSLGEYFRYAGGASKTFGRLFKTEFDTINKVARENVKDLQTQYISLGRDASGAMKSIAVRPLSLDMSDLATRTQIAAQKQAILNQLLKQGSTNLLNFGKNTQWAGRQLMVGFTLPLIAVGSAASKTFMDMEAQAIRFKKVYGDLFTPNAESQQALKDIQELGKEFTKYGIAVSTTVGLAAEAAAAGFKGVDLQRQTAAATRLSILGQVESQKALETTISLQNAFSMSSENLAESIDFLNAVENQTVLSLDDISTAIPKAAPVVQQLGGDVKDLAFLMTAMKEGGINASEGANALKSGLASLINPTGKANDMLLSFGINAKKIVLDNKGDLKKTVVEFATALNMLDPLNRAQAIEQMFGKFQFARLSTLFANVTKEGTQASRVLDLAGASVQQLASLSEKELGMTSESAMNKFKGAVEDLKLSLIPLGEQFLKAVTPIAEFITRVLDKFNGFSDNTKKIIVVLTGIVAGLGPVLLMTVGLVMNGLANMIKLFAFLKSAFNKTGRATTVLGSEVQYMTTEQRNAAAVAASLDQVHTKLAQTFTSEATAVNALTRAYQRAIAAQSQFVPVAPPITRGPIRKFASGKPATVGGTGNKDSELALLMPGETVIPTAMSEKYGSIINAMIADKIPGYVFGKKKAGAKQIPIYPEHAIRLQPGEENMAGRASTTDVPSVLSPLALRIGEARGIAPTLSKVDSGAFDEIYREYKKITTEFVKRVNLEYNTTFKDIKDENERMRKSWAAAGKAVKKQVDSIASPKDRAVVRKTFGLEEDTYATIPTDSREEGGTKPNRSRRGAFKSRLTGLRSYTRIRPGAKRLYERMTKKSAANLQMGHVFDPRMIDISTLESDPNKSGSVATAKAVMERGKKDAKSYEEGKKKGKIKDPYETSTESTRKSPHPKAAKDGRDDARAYAEARDKELTRQSGRSRRAATRPQGAPGTPDVVPVAKKTPRKPGPATRPQGPAPIGATPQPGMTILPIVPGGTGTPPDPDEKPKTRTEKALGKMTGMGGGMGLLGVNMGLSMLPDFAGKSIMQGGLAGANLGMMFGPYGMAAGAAIGTITSAFNTLIAKQKEHAAITRSTFATSTSIIQAFGDKVLDTSVNIINLNEATDNLMSTFGVMTPEIKAAVDAILSLPEDNPMALFVKKISDGSLGIKSLTGEIRSNLSTAISAGGLDPKNAEAYVRVLLQASGRTMDFAEVWKSVSKSVVDAQTATTTSLNKMYDNIVSQGDALTGEGIMFSGASQFYNEEYLLSYESLTSAQATFADGMLNLFNVITNGSLTYEEMQERLNGIKDASFAAGLGVDALQVAINNTGNADLIGRFASIKQMFKDTGTEAEESVDKIVAMALALNTIGDDGLIKFANENKIPLLPGSGKYILEQYMESKQFKDALAAQKKFKDALMGNDYKDYTEGTDKAKTASELYLEVLEKEIKGLEAKRDAQKNSNDETQRQIDLQMKLSDLANQAVLAKISGDYIKAASLDQQAQNLQMEFDQEAELRKKDAEIARLKARAEAIKGGAKLTKAETAKIPKAKLAEIKQKTPGAIERASGGAIRGAGTGTSDSIPAYLSNGEYVIKAKSVKKYGTQTFDALNAGRFADGGLIKGYDKGGLATSPYGPYVPSFPVLRPYGPYVPTAPAPRLNIPLSAGSTATMTTSATGIASDPRFRVEKAETKPFEPIKNAISAPFKLAWKALNPSAAPDIDKQSDYSQRLREAYEKTLNIMHNVYAPSRVGTFFMKPTMDAMVNITAGDGKWNDYTTIGSNFLGYGLIKTGVKGIASGVKNMFSGTKSAATKIKVPKTPSRVIPKPNISALAPEEKAFAMADIDAQALLGMKSANPSTLSVADEGFSFDPGRANAGLRAIKTGDPEQIRLATDHIWELVQSQREALLRSKYPKADLSNVKTFNELYAKEFYGLSKDDIIKIFKGGYGASTGASWRTGADDLGTYFSTNPYVAAEYARFKDRVPFGKELPMFSMDVPISKLPTPLGQGASGMQGSLEFPQVIPGPMLAAQTPQAYDLPAQVYGLMSNPANIGQGRYWPYDDGLFGGGAQVATSTAAAAAKPQGLLKKLLNLPAARRAEALIKQQQIADDLARFRANPPPRPPGRPGAGAPGAPPTSTTKDMFDLNFDWDSLPTSAASSVTAKPSILSKIGDSAIGQKVKTLSRVASTPAYHLKSMIKSAQRAWKYGSSSTRWQGSFDRIGRFQLADEAISRLFGGIASKANPILRIAQKTKDTPNVLPEGATIFDPLNFFEKLLLDIKRPGDFYKATYKNIIPNIRKNYISPAVEGLRSAATSGLYKMAGISQTSASQVASKAMPIKNTAAAVMRALSYKMKVAVKNKYRSFLNVFKTTKVGKPFDNSAVDYRTLLMTGKKADTMHSPEIAEQIFGGSQYYIKMLTKLRQSKEIFGSEWMHRIDLPAPVNRPVSNIPDDLIGKNLEDIKAIASEDFDPIGYATVKDFLAGKTGYTVFNPEDLGQVVKAGIVEQRLAADVAQSVLGHMDLHTGNQLINPATGKIGMLDFETILENTYPNSLAKIVEILKIQGVAPEFIASSLQKGLQRITDIPPADILDMMKRAKVPKPEELLETYLARLDMTKKEIDDIISAKLFLADGGYINKEKLRVPKFAKGGLIRGPGTGISDSVRATLGYAGGGSIRVSNGEYVVKASSVRDYGVKTMDAINNGTATIGANSNGTVYNINMPVTSNNANPEIVANEVMRKLKLEISKNNKTNKVGG